MAVEILHGDCLEHMAAMKAAGRTVSAIVTDPPYHLTSGNAAVDWAAMGPRGTKRPNIGPTNRDGRGHKTGFMGKAWDGGDIAFRPDTWRLALDVLEPGGMMACFGGARTQHRMTCAIEDAGFEIRDVCMWLYGCLSEDTHIVTRKGVMPYHSVKVGDPVLCYDPPSKSYGWQAVQDVFEYEIDDTVYRIRSDNTDQIVSRGHRCLVERGGAETFVVAEEVARQREARVPVLENLPALLEALRGSNASTGGSQQVMRAGMLGGIERRGATGPGSRRDAQGQDESGLCSLRGGVLPERKARRSYLHSRLLLQMQRRLARGRVEGTREQGAGSVVSRFKRSIHRAIDRANQSVMEGRRYLSQAARQLRVSSLCALPAGVPADGADGWLRDGAPLSGGAAFGAHADADGMRASHQSRPVGQPARELDAVRHEQGPQAVRAWRGHHTDLATITPEQYRGRIWCVRVPTGCFVAVRNGMAFPTGNSGFPKSRSLLKPAYEPILLCRKPGPLRELAIDACRIATTDNLNGGTYSPGAKNGEIYGGGLVRSAERQFVQPAGRWPANILHDGSDEVLDQFAAFGSKGSSKAGSVRKTALGIMNDDGWRPSDTIRTGYDDAGSPARFFYAAKASKAERAGTSHPTVKPLALMRWITKLINPPGGKVLDPFAGSGTTGLACLREGFDCVLIEREAEYVAMIEARLGANFQLEAAD